MSEPNDMTCAELADAAAELALGVLTGRERAMALAHLDTCDACREDVRQLMATGEQLLELLPSAEPPVGFETRVLERLGLPVSAAGPGRNGRPGRMRRVLAAAAVVLAVVAAGLGGWRLGAGSSPSANSAAGPLTSASLLSATHRDVGDIFLYAGKSRWMYMSVDLGSGNEAVQCQVIGKDGRVTTVGWFRLADGYGAWGSPDPGSVGPLSGARLVSADGTVLATAAFTAW